MTSMHVPYSTIVFVDFDGVLHRGTSGTFRCVPLLDHLIANCPHVGIVLSTDWRQSMSLDELKDYFVEPATAGRIVDTTPVLDDSQPWKRQREIEAWLATHPEVTLFVALDDTSTLFKPNWSQLHLVDPSTGLTAKDIKELMAFLT